MNRRAWLTGAAAASAYGGVALAKAADRFDAAIGAAAPGATPYPDLVSAIAAAPEERAGKPWRILLGPGVHGGRIAIAKPDIHLIGSGPGTVISAAAAAGDKGPDGRPLGTWGCATMTVTAPGFAARNLTIENAFDYLVAMEGAKYERTGPNGAQAVALMLAEGADRTRFTDVAILGHQDTLFVDKGRSLFERCRITGSVDFIFGGGQALFDHCEVVSRFRPGLQRNHGFLTAPSTARSQAYGLVFLDCRLTREPRVPPASVVLGRPWRPTKTFTDGRHGDPDAVGAAAFIRCFMDDHISADGWDEMGYQAPSGEKVFLEPGEARFAEFGSTGPGAFHTRRRPWLTEAAARRYTRPRVLSGRAPAPI